MSDILDSAKIEAMIKDCLFTDEELPENPTRDNLPDNAVVVEGIVNFFAFNKTRLITHFEKIKEMLYELPLQFRQSGGGGWSFLQACQEKNDEQWTGLHMTMDQLFCLGKGLGLVKDALPRDKWKMLPGGMPYLIILDNEDAWQGISTTA